MGLPIYYLAGNHNDSRCLKAVFSRSSRVHHDREIIRGEWVLIKVETVQPCSDSGFLTLAEEQALKNALAKHHGKKIA